MADEGEVRIVAKLDTTDITSGVDRIAGAGRRMKQVWEETTQLSFPRDQVKEQFSQIETIAREAGPRVGKSFFDGFLGKLLLRDAIYSIIRGMQEVFKEVTQGLDQLSGESGRRSWSLWSSIADSIKATISTIPALGSAQQGLLGANIGNINSQELQRQTLDRIKQDPTILKESTDSLSDQIEELDRQAAEDRKNNARYNFNFAQTGEQGGSPGFSDINNTKLAERDKQRATSRSFLEELLSVAKERDRKSATEAGEQGRKEEEAQAKAKESTQTANDFMAGQVREFYAKQAKAQAEAEKKAEAHQRRVEEHAMADTVTADEASRGRATKDLEETRREISKQHATSAVSINGGVFGRSDAAAALVQHASQQVSLLRSIDAEIKLLRHEKSDMTLL